MNEKIDKITQYLSKLLFRIWMILLAITTLYFFYNIILSLLATKYTSIFPNNDYLNNYPTILNGLIIVLIFALCIKNFYKNYKTNLFLDKQDFKIQIILKRTVFCLLTFFIINIIFRIPVLVPEAINYFNKYGLNTDFCNFYTIVFTFIGFYMYIASVFIIFLARFTFSIFMKDFKKLLKINSLALIGSYALCYIYLFLWFITLFGGGMMN